MRTVLRRTLHGLWYGLGAFLVIVAIAVSVMHFVAPRLDRHKVDIEQWLGRLLGNSVRVGSISAHWNGIRPEVDFSQVTLYRQSANSQQQQVFIRIKSLSVAVNLWSAVWQWSFQPTGIVASGVILKVVQQSKTQYEINGESLSTVAGKSSGASNSATIINWLQQRPFVYASNITLQWQDDSGRSRDIIVPYINLVNRFGRHKILAKAVIQKYQNRTVELKASTWGDLRHLKKLPIKATVRVKNIHLAQWWQPTMHHYRLQQALINGQFWLDWQNSQWHSLQAAIAIRHLQLKELSHSQSLQVPELEGDISWRSGKNSNWYLQSKIKNLTVSAYRSYPSITGLTGVLNLHPKRGVFRINSQHLIVNLPKLFRQDVVVGHLQTKVRWQQQFDHSWKISANSIRAINENATVNGSLALNLVAGNDNPMVSMLFNIREKNAKYLKQYFPENYFKPNLVTWLNQAFIDSSPISGTFIMQGRWRDFPYRQHNGTFLAQAKVHNLTLNYAAQWPIVRLINSRVIFNRNTMQANSSSGKIYQDSKASGVSATIADIGAKTGTVVKVKTNLLAGGQDIYRVMTQTPLSKIVGTGISKLHLKGHSQIQFDLSLPLNHLNNTKLQGRAVFKENRLSIPDFKLQFQKFSGILYFSDRDLSAQHLTALLFNHPVTANLSTSYSDNNTRITDIMLKTHLTIKDIATYLALDEGSYVSGGSDYQFKLALRHDDKPNILTARSDWKGVTVRLPKPFGKTAQQPAPLNFTMTFDDSDDMRLLTSYKKIISVANLLKSSGQHTKLFSTHVRLGGATASFEKTAGLVLSGDIKNIDAQAWYQYFKKLKQKMIQTTTTTKNSNTPSQYGLGSDYIPRLVDVTIGKLTLLDQKFLNIRLKLSPSSDFYHLAIDSQQVVGNIQFPKKFQQGTISGYFQRLQLVPIKGKKMFSSQTSFDFTKWPSLQLSIDDLRWGGVNFGQLLIKLLPRKSGVVLQQLQINSRLLTGQIKGEWLVSSNKKSDTLVSGQLSTQNLSQLLAFLDITPNINADSGSISFDISYPYPPQQFNLAEINGKANIKLTHGYIDKIGSTGSQLDLGKLLSLLSINNILHGFRSLKHPGYTFDQMTGVLKFDRHILSLNNFHFDGSVARIDVLGTINLVSKILDIQLLISPHIASSVPLAAGVATLNPIVGVITWVADELLKSSISRVTASRYLVVGSLNNPQIKKINYSSSVDSTAKSNVLAKRQSKESKLKEKEYAQAVNR